jgi:hypothetical protein
MARQHSGTNCINCTVSLHWISKQTNAVSRSNNSRTMLEGVYGCFMTCNVFLAGNSEVSLELQCFTAELMTYIVCECNARNGRECSCSSWEQETWSWWQVQFLQGLEETPSGGGNFRGRHSHCPIITMSSAEEKSLKFFKFFLLKIFNLVTVLQSCVVSSKHCSQKLL